MPVEATRPQSAAILMEGRALLDAALADGRVGVAYVAALADTYDCYFRERLEEFPFPKLISRYLVPDRG